MKGRSARRVIDVRSKKTLYYRKQFSWSANKHFNNFIIQDRLFPGDYFLLIVIFVLVSPVSVHVFDERAQEIIKTEAFWRKGILARA